MKCKMCGEWYFPAALKNGVCGSARCQRQAQAQGVA